MPRFLRRHVLAVLTIARSHSFHGAEAQRRAPEPRLPGQPRMDRRRRALTTQAEPENAAGSAPRWLTASPLSNTARPRARATLYVQGRYAFELVGNGDWQPFELRFRAPRFDAGINKLDNAFVLDVRNGYRLSSQLHRRTAQRGRYLAGRRSARPSFIFVRQAGLRVRNARHEAADFRTDHAAQGLGGDTNEKELKDLVALGKETFTQLGCEACHLVEKDSAAVSTGPNLFGLFRNEARTREVVEGGEGHRFQVKANREYLHRSVREPMEQLAVAESGPTRGNAYLPIMPVVPEGNAERRADRRHRRLPRDAQ
jgi:hypothetical protein